jgi:hypothetical protein
MRSHGKSKTVEYAIWRGMLSRCNNPKRKCYPRYGGAGIKVCKRWSENFEAFLSDMGPRPSPEHSVERKNNKLGYRPDNCRWATPLEQAKNRRVTTLVVYGGVTMTLSEAVRKAGSVTHIEAARARIKVMKWDVDVAVETPSHPRYRRPTSKFDNRQQEVNRQLNGGK